MQICKYVNEWSGRSIDLLICIFAHLQVCIFAHLQISGMGRALLLTGRPGVGKTTIMRSVVAALGPVAGGFYTEEIRQEGRRVGFRLVTLDGRSGILASVNGSGPHRVGKYWIHLDDLDRVGVGALRRALETADTLVVVIDEIGKMELFSAEFRKAVEAALAGPKTVLATVMAGPHPWADKIKAHPRTTLLEVTRANRAALPKQVLSRLIDEAVGGAGR
jgi:nucleoside-triphosphatase